ncbi:hypothetical protein HK096_002243, partial [Nowakowskiella sp. JEL0078]
NNNSEQGFKECKASQKFTEGADHMNNQQIKVKSAIKQSERTNEIGLEISNLKKIDGKHQDSEEKINTGSQSISLNDSILKQKPPLVQKIADNNQKKSSKIFEMCEKTFSKSFEMISIKFPSVSDTSESEISNCDTSTTKFDDNSHDENDIFKTSEKKLVSIKTFDSEIVKNLQKNSELISSADDFEKAGMVSTLRQQIVIANLLHSIHKRRKQSNSLKQIHLSENSSGKLKSQILLMDSVMLPSTNRKSKQEHNILQRVSESEKFPSDNISKELQYLINQILSPTKKGCTTVEPCLPTMSKDEGVNDVILRPISAIYTVSSQKNHKQKKDRIVPIQLPALKLRYQ